MSPFPDAFSRRPVSRRHFLRQAALASAAAALGACPRPARADPASGLAGWRDRIGLELFTIRSLIATPSAFEAALQTLAQIGLREIEPVGGYFTTSPQHFRAVLDRFGLAMPSTHAAAVEGPDLERTLAGYQVMGIRYTGIGAPGDSIPGSPGFPTRAAARASASAPPAAVPPPSAEMVRRSAAQNNRRGKIAQKFGMKILVHNHTVEFEPLEGGKTNRHEIMVAETDPALVTMQLDIGWAAVAGQDVLDLFRRHPGRYELWHVKDAKDLRAIDPALPQLARLKAAQLCPVGEGDIDYRTIFQHAAQAGLKHFCIEQDNAGTRPDAMNDVRISYHNLVAKILA